MEVIRSTTEEKDLQIANLQALQERNKTEAEHYIQLLQNAALENKNLFDVLMETVKFCSLGQITNALFKVGGQYRRNM
jgi:methylmalonyl-CoA mutase